MPDSYVSQTMFDEADQPAAMKAFPRAGLSLAASHRDLVCVATIGAAKIPGRMRRFVKEPVRIIVVQ